MNPVEMTHPCLVAPCGCGNDGCTALRLVTRTESDYEDLDALPVEEQAAIYCSICACDAENVGGWMDFTDNADDRVLRGAARARYSAYHWSEPDPDLDDQQEEWANAEARIRTGTVRP